MTRISRNGSKRSSRRRLGWLVAGILVFIALLVLPRYPGVVESVYGAGIYPVVRKVFNATTAHLPFPTIGLVLVIVLVLLVTRTVIPLVRRRFTWSSLALGLLSTVSALVFLFYILWGFNYFRPNLADRNAIALAPMDTSQVAEEFRRATAELLTHIEQNRSTLSPESSLARHQLMSECRDLLAPVAEGLGYPGIGEVRCRVLAPAGILMRLSTAGIYIPYSGEGHVDAGLLPVQLPFTITHEMAHGYGITDEGECNFVAYLACRRSTDPFIRFSGLLTYWRYVAWEYRSMYPDAYAEMYQTLPSLLTETIQAIHANNAKYPDIMPRLRDKVYDSYLKSNGVREGLMSYNRVVLMVHAYGDKLDVL